MAKVCDKCYKKMDKGTIVETNIGKFEVCDSCMQKIVNWINTKETGFIGRLFDK